MIATKHTQSLTDFRQNATQTLDRINQSGEAELITVNGEARAVLLAPATFDEMARELTLARDAATIRLAMEQSEQGKSQEAGRFFKQLRQTLRAKKRTAVRKGKR